MYAWPTLCLHSHLPLRNADFHSLFVLAVQCKRSPVAVSNASGCAINSYNQINLEESTCSYRAGSSGKLALQNGKELRSYSNDLNAISGGSKCIWDAAETLLHKQIAANSGSCALAGKFEVSNCCLSCLTEFKKY